MRLFVLFVSLLILCISSQSSIAQVRQNPTGNNSAVRQNPAGNNSAVRRNPCAWGSSDCNRCVFNVKSELDRIENRFNKANRIRFDGYAYPKPSDYLLHRMSKSYEHIQSIGRIAGVGNQEYFVFTHSTKSSERNKEGALAVVRMGHRQRSQGYALGNMPNGDGVSPITSNRTVARTYTGNNHPGGTFVLGHYVYVAQWCQPHGKHDWCMRESNSKHPSGFSVYDARRAHWNGRVNSNPPIHRRYENTKDDGWMPGTSTASIAAVKLGLREYLVAVGGSGGKKYGFYTASSPTGPFEYDGSSSIGKWGENAAMITECGTEDIYFLQMEEHGGRKADQVHLYKLNVNNSKYDFEFIKSRTFHCRGSKTDGAADWCHFDAGAGTYVTPRGKLILYGIDWQQSSHGNVRLVEFD